MVLVLALGIGANTALFSLLDALLLRLLPVDKPDQLVHLVDASSKSNALTFPMFNQVGAGARLLKGVTATVNFSSQSIEEQGEERDEAVQEVSRNYFEVLGVPASRGRVFRAVNPSEGAVAVISEAYWRKHYGADLAALGAHFRYMRRDFTVIGVAPPGFRGALKEKPADIWVPFEESTPRDSIVWGRGRWLITIARLRTGVIEGQAAAEVSAILGRRMNAVSVGNGVWALRGNLYRPLVALQLLAGLVLAIACVNLMNLMLARTESREPEISMRLAIGASRGRLARQLLTESLLVSGIGGVLALPLAYWISGAVLRFLPPDAMPALVYLRFHPDLRLLGFTAALSLLTCLLFGLAPAYRSSHLSLLARMRRPVSRGRAAVGWKSGGIVAGEVALCSLLLITAGLLSASLWNLRRIDSGFDPEHVLTATAQPPKASTAAEYAQRLELLRERLAVLPGVRAAAYSNIGVLSGFGINFNIDAEGHSHKPKEYPVVYEMRVSPDFFAAMGTPLLRGRNFTDAEDAISTQVAIVNESFAREFFPGKDALRGRFGTDGPASSGAIEIVGVVRDTKLGTLREDRPSIYYRPVRQRKVSSARFVVRTTDGMGKLTAGLLRIAHDVDRRMTLKDVVPFTEVVDRTLVVERVMANVSSAFAVLALLIASVGLYGLIAHNAARRTKEIGIRMALGASSASVQWMVLRRSLLLVGLGLAAGVPLSLVVTRSIASMLFGLSPADPATIVTAVLVLLVAALAACYLPARRAARVDPMTALRHE